jgi:hypothetical protein
MKIMYILFYFEIKVTNKMKRNETKEASNVKY